MGGDEDKFKAIYQLGDSAGEYTIHGGAVPVRVKGVEGAVAVCTVSGLRMFDVLSVTMQGAVLIIFSQTKRMIIRLSLRA
jgi:uncharacterized protein (UPF0303 family)